MQNAATQFLPQPKGPPIHTHKLPIKAHPKPKPSTRALSSCHQCMPPQPPSATNGSPTDSPSTPLKRVLEATLRTSLCHVNQYVLLLLPLRVGPGEWLSGSRTNRTDERVTKASGPSRPKPSMCADFLTNSAVRLKWIKVIRKHSSQWRIPSALWVHMFNYWKRTCELE